MMVDGSVGGNNLLPFGFVFFCTGSIEGLETSRLLLFLSDRMVSPRGSAGSLFKQPCNGC